MTEPELEPTEACYCHEWSDAKVSEVDGHDPRCIYSRFFSCNVEDDL